MAVRPTSELYCRATPCANTLTEPQRAAWEQLLTRVEEVAPFAYPEWLEMAARTGAARPWQLLTVYRGQAPVALLPLFRTSPWTAVPHAHLASEYPPFLCDPEVEESVWLRLATWLREARGVEILSLGVWTSAARIEQLDRLCRRVGVTVGWRRLLPNVRLTLPKNWDDYVAHRSKSAREALRTAESRILRDYPNSADDLPLDEPSTNAALDELVRLYVSRWQGQPGGCVLDNARNVAFYRQAVWWAISQNLGIAPLLRVNDVPVVVGTIYHVPGRPSVYCHMIARDTEALPARYSPGLFHAIQMLRWAIERGATNVYLGAGDSPYKRTLGGVEVPQWEVTLARTPLAAQVIPRVERAAHLVARLPVHMRYRARQLLQRRAA